MEKQPRSTTAIKTLLPLIYFIGIAIYWFYDNYFGGQHFNYIAIAVTIVLLIQLIFQHKLLGISLGILFLVGSLLMFLAVLSEFNQFKMVSAAARQLIIIGSLLSLVGIVMAVVMTVTNLKSFKKIAGRK